MYIFLRKYLKHFIFHYHSKGYISPEAVEFSTLLSTQAKSQVEYKIFI